MLSQERRRFHVQNYIVYLDSATCTCRCPQDIQIICSHCVVICYSMKLLPMSCIPQLFKRENYIAMYVNNLSVIDLAEVKEYYEHSQLEVENSPGDSGKSSDFS